MRTASAAAVLLPGDMWMGPAVACDDDDVLTSPHFPDVLPVGYKKRLDGRKHKIIRAPQYQYA